jgi:hypothetical protein
MSSLPPGQFAKYHLWVDSGIPYSACFFPVIKHVERRLIFQIDLLKVITREFEDLFYR